MGLNRLASYPGTQVDDSTIFPVIQGGMNMTASIGDVASYIKEINDK